MSASDRPEGKARAGGIEARSAPSASIRPPRAPTPGPVADPLSSADVHWGSEPADRAPDSHDTADHVTSPVEGNSGAPEVRRIRFTAIDAPEPDAVWDSRSDSCSIGSHSLNDVVIEDPTVSRFHCEVKIGAGGVRIHDLESRNGTIVDGVRVTDAFLRSGSLIRIGRVSLRFDFVGTENNRLPISSRDRFGSLVSASIAMRGAFALMERAAASNATVLLEGETGTGKSQAADGIHKESARRNGPFIVVDCGAMPAQLLEGELFGYEKGAFTGASSRRIGAFEEATGGTVFLDEIGELPIELQPKLLRVIESREVRRIGMNTFTPVDVRMIAATNRDLRAEVNAGRFRSDLFFRLAVLRIVIPPLRQRPEDIPLIVEGLLTQMAGAADSTEALRMPQFIANLQHAAWPGNVRELRNHIERCLVLQAALPAVEAPNGSREVQVDPNVPYAEARRRAIDGFERAYLGALLRQYKGTVAQAAAAAGIDRVYLYRLLRRHGLKPQ